MKKRYRGILALLLAVTMIICALPINAFAEDTLTPYEGEIISVGDGETGYILHTTTDELGGDTTGYSAAPVFNNALASQSDGSMYNQLTQRQKVCYDAIEAVTIDRIETAALNGGYRQISIRIADFYGVELYGSYNSSGTFITGSSSANTERQIYTDLCAAIVALRYDRADIVWMGDMRYGYRWSRVNSTTAKVGDALVAFRLYFGGQEKAMWETTTARAEAIAGQIDQNADVYTQVRAVHDLLAQNNTYNYTPSTTFEEDVSHVAYSALVFGDAYEPVCDGYSKAMKMILDELGIDCALASSLSHMWNNVKMDDGEWYNVDLTWDDTDNSVPSYSYFLIGSQTQIGGTAFSAQTDHVEENPFVVTPSLNALTLRFPTKNRVAYEYLGRNYDDLRFPDVKRSAWYYNYVEAAAEAGLFQGDTSGLFLPGNRITRAQFVQVMANSAGVDLAQYEGVESFTDVDTGKWYAKAVAWAKATGIMKGDKSGTFRPNANISREEMCLVLYNAMSITGTPAAPDGSFIFPDDGNIAQWARTAVYTCYRLGYIQGNADGSMSPKSSTLRSEAATVFVRFLNLEAAAA